MRAATRTTGQAQHRRHDRLAKPRQCSSSRAAAARRSLADRAVAALAAADEWSEGIAAAVELLWRESDAARVEWWISADDDSPLRLEAAAGRGGGPRVTYSLGRAGAVVVHGAPAVPVGAAACALAPIVRRRRAEERLLGKVVELARRNEALEDFAALVAHELKAPLLEVLHGGDPAAAAGRALELVESILAVARAGAEGAETPVAECLGAVLHELGPVAAAVECSAEDESPLPPGALSIVLSNLVRNACAAGARRIGVGTACTGGSWTLTVDDDGVGLGGDEYASGSGVGLGLCRRLVERFGGRLELEPRRGGGTRARLLVAGGVS